MSSAFPNRTVFSLFTALAAAKTISGIDNASPAEATSTAHGYSDAGILLLSMPSRLDQRVFRTDNITTNTFELEGLDTSSVTIYPSGFGVGSSQLASSPVPLSQTVDVQSSGGEQQFYQWVYLEDGRQRQRPTFKNARALELTLDYDPALAWHAALLAADEAGTPYVLQAALPNGSKIYWSMYVGFDGEPDFKINENQKTKATFAMASPYSTRYAS
jgi:Phage tail tube protein, TTP